MPAHVKLQYSFPAVEMMIKLCIHKAGSRDFISPNFIQLKSGPIIKPQKVKGRHFSLGY